MINWNGRKETLEGMSYVIYRIFTLLNRIRVWNVTTGRVLIESVIALDTKLNPHSCLIVNYGKSYGSRISRGVKGHSQKVKGITSLVSVRSSYN